MAPSPYEQPAAYHRPVPPVPSVPAVTPPPTKLKVNITPQLIDDYLFLSYESPRPMGPKELPDYDDFESPFQTTPSRDLPPRPRPTRQFQSLLRSLASPLNRPPYPTDDNLDFDLEDDYNFLHPELTPSRSRRYSSGSPNRTSQIVTDSINSNQRIPSLHNQLDPGLRIQKSMPQLPSEHHEGDRTPLPIRSYTLNHRGLPPRSPSPVRSNTLSVPQGSPQFGRSPSLYYQHTFDYDHDDDDSDNVPWNSHETSDETALSDYDNDLPESPINLYFDYSILPDLPAELPTRPLTLHATMSFVKRPTLTTKRMNDDLPPVPLDLPQLPFSSSSLVSQHFSSCDSVWSLGSIFSWCLRLRVWLHDLFIPKREFKKALIKLVVFHQRSVPLDLIGQNVDRIVEELLRSGAIEYYTSDNDEGVRMNEHAQVSGVMVELTPCYCSDEKHTTKADAALRCYSSQCVLNKMIDHEIQLRSTNIHELTLGEDWALHWKLTADDLRQFDKNVSKRQSLLFDLLRYEQTFIQRAKCFVDIVGPEFIKAARILVGSDIVAINNFEDDVLKPGQELVHIHEEKLFLPLLKVLITDGKFISNVTEIANIYVGWSQAVKNALLKYMSTVPMIEDLLSYELLKKWVDHNVRNIERVKELKVNGPLLFMSTFNSRYQSLPLQLSDIRGSFDNQEPEYVALTKPIESIKRLGARVNQMKVHADNIHALKRIYKQLIWKSNIHKININLGLENRKFFYRGELSRKGDFKINTNVNHLILLDNYLFITEKIKNQRSGGYSYRVVENPIPTEFLLFEIKEALPSTTIDLNLGKTLTLNTNSSSSPTTDTPDEDDPSTYPLKLRYAGRGKHNAYTFFARSERDRAEWITHLTAARTNLCARLRKTEPYQLAEVAVSHFAYEYNNRMTKLPVCAGSDPLDELATKGLTELRDKGYTGDLYLMKNLVFSKAQTIAVFDYKHTRFFLLGLASGVYCSDGRNKWKRVINGTDFTKISVMTAINLVIVLGGKSLRYYLLDSLVNVYYERRDSMSLILLSNEPVTFFEVGKHREITMLFYAKRKGNSSNSTNFKVLIPETDNDGVFNAFKVVKKFYVEAECFGISIFNSSFAVHTNKGFEILELDKLIPRSVPDLPFDKKLDAFGTKRTAATGVDAVRKALHASIRPMGMFKLTNNAEFLLVYNDFAVFTNKHGKMSRMLMLKFAFRAKAIAFRDNHLFLVTDEVVEIWAISDQVNGTNKLIQVLVGKDLTLLDPHSMTLGVANPKVVGLQLIFGLLMMKS